MFGFPGNLWALPSEGCGIALCSYRHYAVAVTSQETDLHQICSESNNISRSDHTLVGQPEVSSAVSHAQAFPTFRVKLTILESTSLPNANFAFC